MKIFRRSYRKTEINVLKSKEEYDIIYDIGKETTTWDI